MSVVYFVAGGSSIKIGFSVNVKSRFASLQTSSVDELRLLGTIPGGVEREREIHAQLAKHRKRGEWFADCEEVRQVIIDLCGHDVFDVKVPPPPPPPPKQLAEILDEEFERISRRFVAFANFCIEDIENNQSAKLWRLHVTKRHLIIAAIQYARLAIEKDQKYLFLHPDDVDSVGHAAACAECCECHVEMITADDPWFLDGWSLMPRINPLFETEGGKPRWASRQEADAAGWVRPELNLLEAEAA